MLRLVGALALLLLASVAGAQPKPLPLDTIKLPPGFAIELVARVDNARQMVLGPKGTLFVGSMQAGKVYAVRPVRDKCEWYECFPDGTVAVVLTESFIISDTTLFGGYFGDPDEEGAP